MAHHGSNLPPYDGDFKDLLKSAFDNPLEDHLRQINPNLGATGKFPEGKVSEGDQGEIQFAIAVYNGKLIINFGEVPIQWVGLTKQQVADLIELLQKRVTEL